MTWIKLTDDLPDNAKVYGLSNDAFRMHIEAMCHAGRTLSDGFIPADRVHRIPKTYSPEIIEELVTARLWDVVEGGWEIHDWLKFNPAAEKVKAEREAGAIRREIYGAKLHIPIRERDKDHCRFCAEKVRWNDRKSAIGGTYDLVDPRLGVTLENTVTACRGCVSERKSNPDLDLDLIPITTPARPVPDPKGLGNEEEDRRSPWRATPT